MEPDSDSLGFLIEFSIGLAGFSAIASVFLNRSTELSPLDRFRILNLLFVALTPAFIAFLYFGLRTALQDLDSAAKASSAVLAVCLLTFTVMTFRRLSRLPEEHRSLIPPASRLFMRGAAYLNITLQAISSAFFAGTTAFSVLYFGLVLLLLQAVIQFVRIIIARPAEGSSDTT